MVLSFDEQSGKVLVSGLYILVPHRKNLVGFFREKTSSEAMRVSGEILSSSSFLLLLLLLLLPRVHEELRKKRSATPIYLPWRLFSTRYFLFLLRKENRRRWSTAVSSPVSRCCVFSFLLSVDDIPIFFGRLISGCVQPGPVRPSPTQLGKVRKRPHRTYHSSRKLNYRLDIITGDNSI